MDVRQQRSGDKKVRLNGLQITTRQIIVCRVVFFAGNKLFSDYLNVFVF